MKPFLMYKRIPIWTKLFNFKVKLYEESIPKDKAITFTSDAIIEFQSMNNQQNWTQPTNPCINSSLLPNYL